NRQRTLTAYGRYEATLKELVVELAPDGSGYTAQGDKRAAERHRIAAKLSEILPMAAPGLEYGEISSEWGDGAPTKKLLLDVLREGFETRSYGRTGEGKKGNPFRYFLMLGLAG